MRVYVCLYRFVYVCVSLCVYVCMWVFVTESRELLDIVLYIVVVKWWSFFNYYHLCVAHRSVSDLILPPTYTGTSITPNRRAHTHNADIMCTQTMSSLCV